MLKTQFSLLIFGGFLLLSCAPQTTTNQGVTVKTVKTVEEITVKIDTPDTASIPLLKNKPSLQHPLASFYNSLKSLQGSNKQISILHLGDSLTAGDRFSGRLRDLLQHRFGSAGRGMLSSGKPFRYFNPTNVSLSQTKGWQVINSFKSPTNPPYGLSGFRFKSDSPNHSITLKMKDGTKFNHIEIEFLHRPRGGTILVEIDNHPTWEISTDASTRYVDRSIKTVTKGGRMIKISPKGDGPIELLSWTFKRNQSGILYHSHGIIGATVNVIGHWSPNLVEWEIGLLQPSLIIVAYGTNEGFNDKLDLNKYKRDFKKRLGLLTNAAPQASIIVVGPPDGNRLPSFCKKRRNRCSSLTPFERENYEKLLTNKSQQLCRWHPPPKLQAVREIQRKIAAEAGYLFWNWSNVMNGTCGIHAWTKQGPRSAMKDHVHFTKRGYQKSANALFKEIMAHFRY